MSEKSKLADRNNDKVKNKKKMSFTRFTNLLYEASSSLVPGTGELYNTKYIADGNTEMEDMDSEKNRH